MRKSVDLAERNRREVAEGLASVLADTHTLYFKTHAFQWNRRHGDVTATSRADGNALGRTSIGCAEISRRRYA